MKIKLASYLKNPNIGLFGLTTEKYCLLPRGANDTFVKLAEETLGVKVIRSNIAGTELIGALCVGFDNKLIVPEITFDSEIEEIEKNGIKVEVFETDQTALGNNILLSNKIAIMGENYSKEEEKIFKKLTGAKVYKKTVVSLNLIGSLMTITKKGGVVHPDMSDKELKEIEKLFKVKIERATVNRGNPYVSIGVLANSNGVIAGDMSRGAELTDIQIGLGVVKNG